MQIISILYIFFVLYFICLHIIGMKNTPSVTQPASYIYIYIYIYIYKYIYIYIYIYINLKYI